MESTFYRMGNIIFMHISHQFGKNGVLKASALMGTASVQSDKVGNIRMS